MKVASTSMRTKPRPGMLVRETPQASGMANSAGQQRRAAPSFSELNSAST